MRDLDRIRVAIVEQCDTCDGDGCVPDPDDPRGLSIGCPDCVGGWRHGESLSLGELATLLGAALGKRTAHAQRTRVVS